MSLSKITAMLQEAIGLDQESIGAGAIHSAIRKRMQQTSVDDEARFVALLQSSPAEMTALIEAVVVPETWFFRNGEAFRLMVEHLAGEWRHSHPGRTPRLLSIPCSSGEEAYSMAMALLDAGFSADGFHIDALDISELHLHRARLAVYGQGSFRGGHLEFRERFFHRTETGYALDPAVRRTVHFQQGNILDRERMLQLGRYDIICCRNLLIYFNPHDRKRTEKTLAAMLARDGLLFVGHAETGPMWKDMFAAVPYPMAFAYRPLTGDKRTASPPHSDIRLPAAAVSRPAAVQISKRSYGPGHPLPIGPLGERPAGEPLPVPQLEDIAQLADQGLLEQAHRLCEVYLREESASAEGWFLLGLIDDGQGRKDQAREGFRKALYLDPDHYQAMVHLALLQEQMGEHRAAQHLRDRIQRLSERHKRGSGNV